VLVVLKAIAKPQLSLQLQKIFLCCTSMELWNSLPDHVVDVNSLKQFKTRLDKCYVWLDCWNN